MLPEKSSDLGFIPLPACVVGKYNLSKHSLDPDQAQQNVGPDLDPKIDTLMMFLKEFFEKVDFEKIISRAFKEF